MKKLIVILLFSFILIGCEAEDSNMKSAKINNALTKIDESSSMSVKYTANFDEAFSIELNGKYDFQKESFKHVGVSTYEQEQYEFAEYYEKVEDGYNFYYLREGENWYYTFSDDYELIFEGNSMLYENQLEKPFSFLRNVDEENISIVDENIYLVKVNNDSLFSYIFSDEVIEYDYFEVHLTFEGNNLKKIEFEVNVDEENALFKWEILSLNDYEFELSEEIKAAEYVEFNFEE